MGKLIFKYGTMHSSKTAQLLMEAYNFKLQGKKLLSLRPRVDTRSSEGYIESRTPLDKIECIMLNPEIPLSETLSNVSIYEYDCIMIDEAQFLTKEQVYELHVMTTVTDINIVAYGLKNSYIEGELFEGSAALLFYSDELHELKTTCQYCNKDATQNLRLINGQAVYEGDTIEIGDVRGEEGYVQVCNKHYFSGGTSMEVGIYKK